MRRLLTILILGALAVAAGWWISGLPGRVGFNIGSFAVETTAPVAIVLGGVALILVYIVLRLLGVFVFFPRRFGAWRRRSRRVAGDRAVTRALVTIASGNKSGALNAAARARRLLGDTPQTLLLTAEAARINGQDEAASQAYLTLADREDASFLGLRGLLRQAIQREDWAEASRLARRADAAQPGAEWLRHARLELAARTGDWQPALSLAGPDAPLAVLATAASRVAKGEEALSLARRAWKADRGFAPAAIAYAEQLRHDGQEDRAQKTLRQTWEIKPNPAIAECALGLIEDAPSRLRRGRDLVRSRPMHPESHLLLARLKLGTGAIDEARNHAEAAASGGMRERRLFLLRADIEEAAHGDTPEGRTIQRDLLREAAEAEPDAAWTCGSCGSIHAAWSPACPTCHAPASLTWGQANAAPLPRRMLISS